MTLYQCFVDSKPSFSYINAVVIVGQNRDPGHHKIVIMRSWARN